MNESTFENYAVVQGSSKLKFEEEKQKIIT